MTAPKPKKHIRAWRSKADAVSYSKPTTPQGMHLHVVQFSRSYGELWEHLASDLKVDFHLIDPTERQVPGDVAVVVLAAGGVEREALDWLDGHGGPVDVPVIAVGSDPSRRLAIQMVGSGAGDYFVLPEDLETLRNAVTAVVDSARARNVAPHPTAPTAEAFRGIVGQSRAMMTVLERAEPLLRHCDATALIVGETGTGKELLARGIHEGGQRAPAPFVAVNCSALPDTLFESELFGHERGAFTNAHVAKPGLFEVADGGTLFLDEIGTLSPGMQAKLLRVLEDMEIRRVGGTKPRKVDVRILAATNENVKASLGNGGFRQDLYFRLSVVTLQLPPLRERENDILLIAEAYLTRCAEQHGLPVPTLTADIRSALLGYRWPGNVRELKNAVERALLLSPPGELKIDELIPTNTDEPPIAGALPFPSPLRDIDTAAARATLDLCGGNRSEAARRLEISRKRLRRLLNGTDPE